MSIDLSPLFHPSSIAIIGASADKAKFSTRVVEALHALEYRGIIYLVNTNTNAVPGEHVFRPGLGHPRPYRLGYPVCTGTGRSFGYRRLRPKRGEGGHCPRSGICRTWRRRAGSAGRMEKTARASGMRIVGPNCMGIACPSSHINMVTTRHPFLDRGGLSFAGQSGWATEYALIGGMDRGLGFSAVVSCGNQADLSIADYLDYFSEDPETKVIGAYVEGFKDGRRFLKAAGQAARKKPVVIWKSGRTPSGALFTQSHTGSMAGAGEIATGGIYSNRGGRSGRD